jgi:hypothetical protein
MNEMANDGDGDGRGFSMGNFFDDERIAIW